MTPLDIDTVLGWRGRTVRDADGEKLGTFGDVFLDRESDQPAWGGVRTGLFGRRESFVPLSEVREEGDDLHVPYAADEVKGAPQLDPDVALTAEEERALYDHYGREYGEPAGEAGDEHGGETGAVATDADRSAQAGRDVDDDEDDDGLGDDGASAGGPFGEGEMVRSEEEVRVREGPMRPKERVRLRKVLVTDHVERTVPVRKEVVELETDPPAEAADRSVVDEEDADAPARDRTEGSSGSPPA